MLLVLLSQLAAKNKCLIVRRTANGISGMLKIFSEKLHHASHWLIGDS